MAGPLSGDLSRTCNIKHMWGHSVIKLTRLHVQSKLRVWLQMLHKLRLMNV